jgi:hypothetical protein
MIKPRRNKRLHMVVTQEERDLIDFICASMYLEISDLMRAALSNLAYNDEQILAENVRQIVRNKGL